MKHAAESVLTALPPPLLVLVLSGGGSSGAIQDAVGLDRVAPVDVAATAERRSRVQSD